jgi:prepilin-type N-terminal cleavage/methylation domain-containing protein
MNSKKIKTGFTMIELLVVISITAIIATSGILVYAMAQRRVTLNLTADQIQQVLRFARQRSVSQQEGLSWGVHFDNTNSGNPWYAIYKGSPYNQNNITEYYSLPNPIRFSNPASGQSLDVEFLKLTGNASGNATVTIQLFPEGTSQTILIFSSGLIELQSNLWRLNLHRLSHIFFGID